ncbi:hypothetical protein [Pleionea sediminis]|uniref:hypothetical protein n=1 Tax=Pleionea sediminis TaxID=2569479 RepID=UPI0013DE2E9B|nr:hypothetical protein [Pleionea sediminis]
MSFDDKTLDEMYTELERVERERDAKGRNHPDYPLAEIMVKSIQKSIDKKRNQDK